MLQLERTEQRIARIKHELHRFYEMNNIKKTSARRENPFMQPYNTPHGTVPFDRIRISDYEPAFMKGIEEEDKEIAAIVDNPQPATFANTIERFNEPGGLLDRVSGVFFNLLSAETNDEMDSLAQKLSPILSEHSNNIMLNEGLFKRVKAVHDNPPQDLTKEQQTLLDKTYDAFVRSGALLDEEGKKTLRSLTMKMSQLALQFSQNLLHETNAFQLNITDKKDLNGLPDTALEAAALTAKENGQEGWTFTLQAPSFMPVLTYADNRELRKTLYKAHSTLCTKNNKYNNLPIVTLLVNLRRQLAELLGYKTFADYVLCKRMALTTDNVYRLLYQLIEAYKPTARKETRAITAKARASEGKNFVVKPWDIAYYSHKLQLEKYNIDAEMLRPYFQLEKVIEGVFQLANRLYGITFKKNKNIPIYHPDVTAYEVFDKDGSYLAVFYADFHPRKGKQSGAWMTDFKGQWIDGDVNSRPHVSVTMNLTKPTEKKPALLTLGEVETFLHEFGHSLHGMFANTHYAGLSGTNVYWDFVELPSQFMENFSVEKDFLHTFARHYITGEPLPDELIDRIVQSRNFNVATACLRQVSLGLIDMAYYTLDKTFDDDVRTFERAAMKPAVSKRLPARNCMSTQFSHIMAGGYAAGYYSYKWAEVLDADAFAYFKEKGLFNREVADSFRYNVLSKGGTEPPMVLYKRFRGQEPSIDALLKRNGIKH